MVRPIADDGTPATQRFQRALHMVAGIMRAQVERYPQRRGGGAAAVGGVEAAALRIALLDSEGRVAAMSTAAESVEARRSFSKRVLYELRLMVGSLGRHGTLCAQHFASIFATSRTCWATDTWATNYRSWAHAAAGALIHPEASASLLVGTRHITISFRWHAQLLPITIARAPSSEDNLSTVARMLRGADVFRTEWIPARAAVSFDVSTFGCPVRFVVATLAAVARDGDHTASCEVQIEERTTMEGSVGGRVLVAWRTCGEWTGRAARSPLSYTAEVIGVTTAASHFTIKLRHTLQAAGRARDRAQPASAGLAIFRAEGCVRAVAPPAAPTPAPLPKSASMDDPQWLATVVKYRPSYWHHLDAQRRPIAPETAFTLEAMLKGERVFQSSPTLPGQPECFVVTTPDSESFLSSTKSSSSSSGFASPRPITDFVPHVADGTMTHDEFKQIVFGERTIYRSVEPTRIVRFALATPKWDSTRYEAQVEEFTISQGGTEAAGVVLIPWSEFGTYDGAYDAGLSQLRDAPLAKFVTDKNTFLPSDYTPEIIQVSTSATAFKISVRHSFRGLAPAGLAVCRMEGYGQLHPRADAAQPKWVGWTAHADETSGTWFYHNKSTGESSFEQPANAWVRLDKTSSLVRYADGDRYMYHHTGADRMQSDMPNDCASLAIKGTPEDLATPSPPLPPFQAELAKQLRIRPVTEGQRTSEGFGERFGVNAMLRGEGVWYTKPTRAFVEHSFIAHADGLKSRRILLATFTSPSTWVKVEEIDASLGTTPLCGWTEMGTYNGGPSDDPKSYGAEFLEIPSGALSLRIVVRHEEGRYDSAAGLAVCQIEGWDALSGVPKDAGTEPPPLPPPLPAQLLLMGVNTRGAVGEAVVTWNRPKTPAAKYVLRATICRDDTSDRKLQWYFMAQSSDAEHVLEKHTVTGLGERGRVRFSVASIGKDNIEGKRSKASAETALAKQLFRDREIHIEESEADMLEVKSKLSYVYSQYSAASMLTGRNIYITEEGAVGTESHFEFTAEHFEVKRFVMAATFSQIIVSEMRVQEVDGEGRDGVREREGNVIVPWGYYGSHSILARGSGTFQDFGNGGCTVDGLLRGRNTFECDGGFHGEHSFTVMLPKTLEDDVVRFHIASLNTASSGLVSEIQIVEMLHTMGPIRTSYSGRVVVPWGVYGSRRGKVNKSFRAKPRGEYHADTVNVHTHAREFTVMVRVSNSPPGRKTYTAGIAVLQAETLASFMNARYYFPEERDVETTAKRFRVSVRTAMNCPDGFEYDGWSAGIAHFRVQGPPRVPFDVAQDPASDAAQRVPSMLDMLKRISDHAFQYWHNAKQIWTTLLKDKTMHVNREEFHLSVGTAVWHDYSSFEPLFHDRYIAVDILWQALCYGFGIDPIHTKEMRANLLVAGLETVSEERATGHSMWLFLNRDGNDVLYAPAFARCIRPALERVHAQFGTQTIPEEVTCVVGELALTAIQTLTTVVGCGDDGGIDATEWAAWFARGHAPTSVHWWKPLGLAPGVAVARRKKAPLKRADVNDSAGALHEFTHVVSVNNAALSVSVDAVGVVTEKQWNEQGWSIVVGK